MSKQFAEFRVGDLFEIEPSAYRSVKSSNNLQLVPQITNTTRPNGVSSFEPFIPNNEGNSITFSDTTVGGDTLFYQPVGFLGYSHVQIMTARDDFLNLRVAMYVISAFRKAVDGQFNYGAKFNREVAANTLIHIPVTDTTANTPNPEPDWEYMENYIKTIERKYIDQIAEHNTREQEILEQLHPESVNKKPEAHGFEEIRVGDLFEITPTKKPRISGVSGYVDDEELLSRPGRNPYIAATASNNGIKCWTSVEPENKSDAITISTTADSSNTIFYQPVPFVGRQQIAQIRKKGNAPLTKRIAFYVMTLLRKHTLYSNYGNKLTKEELGDFKLHLPVTPAGEIDWDYMEQYITWVEARERESRTLRAAREEQILEQLHKHH